VVGSVWRVVGLTEESALCSAAAVCPSPAPQKIGSAPWLATLLKIVTSDVTDRPPPLATCCPSSSLDRADTNRRAEGED
jgi:hypothetical protein